VAKLTTVEGIGEKQAQKLTDAGIVTTDALLAQGKTPQGRQKIAESTGISERLILDWLNRIDLFRIKGIGEEYSDLLESVGVDTVPELAQRNAENLYETIIGVNTKKKLVRQPPGQEQVADWIEQAKQLPRVIEY
jgi:predicted flap endonuclease-1-like 5' DNA nuclease